MTKQEQLIEYNIQDIIEYIVQDFKIEFDQAMQLFYNSQTFDRLMDIETGLYLESSAYVYGIQIGKVDDIGSLGYTRWQIIHFAIELI